MLYLLPIVKLFSAAGAFVPAAFKLFLSPVAAFVSAAISFIPGWLRPHLIRALAVVALTYLVLYIGKRIERADWQEKIRIEREADQKLTRELINATRQADEKAEQIERENDDLQKRLETMRGGDGTCDWFGDDWLRDLNRIK